MIKRSLHQEELTISNFYAPENRSSKYMKQKWITQQGEMGRSTIFRNTNSPFFVIDGTSGSWSNMHTGALHHTSDTCRIIHLTAAEYKLVEYMPLTYTSQHDPKVQIEKWELRREWNLHFSTAHISYTKHSYCKKLAQRVL